jgi:hypothetical protein
MDSKKSQMLNRVTFGIENGNVSRFVDLSTEECAKIAKETLNATNWKSLAAARRHLSTNRIWFDF